MENIKCPCCNSDVLIEGITEEGYITYNTIGKNKFVPESIDSAIKHLRCLKCNATIDSSIMRKINIIYPQVKINENDIELHYRCASCGQLTAEGIYSQIVFNIVSMEKFYKMQRDIYSAYIEKKLYPNKRYIAMIVWESKEFYCEECHEELLDLENPPSFQDFINNRTITYETI